MDSNIIFKHHPVGELAGIITTFIQFKRSLGYIYEVEEGTLYRFSVFSQDYTIKTREVPLQLVEDWMALRKNEKVSTQRARGLVVLQMLNFACDHGYIVHFPVMLKRFHVPKYIPYIFTQTELKLFFYACDHVRPYSGTSRHHVIPILFRLIFSCGLRVSEAANLKCSDVDLAGDIITIQGGKNGSERVIPLSDSMAKSMKQFHSHYHGLGNHSEYFFKGKYRNKLTRYRIYKWFRICLEAAGIPHLGKGKGPRLHDLRHSFCVHCLKKMQIQGIDLYAALPILSKFVGHVSIRETQHYLRLTAEFFPDILDQINKQCQGIIPSVEVDKNETY